MKETSRRRFLWCLEKKLDMIIKSIRGRKLYIYGAGQGGSLLIAELEKRGICINGVCDKNIEPGEFCLEKYTAIAINTLNPRNCYVIVSLLHIDLTIVELMGEKGFQDSDWCYLYESINREDVVYNGIKIGKYTYGYEELLSDFPLASSIGRYCSINGTARIWNNHPLECITTSPILDNPNFIRREEYINCNRLVKKYGKHCDNAPFENSPLRKNRPVIIGNDVWIGAYVSILPGVIIGDGAIIGAGAVVTKDIKPYAIVGGVPAKIIKYRYSNEEIEILLRVKWWEWSDEKFDANIELLYNPKMFFDKFRI